MELSLKLFVFLAVTTISFNDALGPGDRIRILSRGTGKALEARGKTLIMNNHENNLKQMWILEGTESGEYILENAAYEGKVLDAHLDTEDVWTNGRHCGENQKFHLHPNGTITTPHHPGKNLEVIRDNVQMTEMKKISSGDIHFFFKRVLQKSDL
ncbi:hypothetical protein JTB14_008332 [Gonioctena quinquepunctata]|nr:hypothetical protein JTB14_008332 [Gonioctena quinquepunctata]